MRVCSTRGVGAARGALGFLLLVEGGGGGSSSSESSSGTTSGGLGLGFALGCHEDHVLLRADREEVDPRLTRQEDHELLEVDLPPAILLK